MKTQNEESSTRNKMEIKVGSIIQFKNGRRQFKVEKVISDKDGVVFAFEVTNVKRRLLYASGVRLVEEKGKDGRPLPLQVSP